MFFSPLFVYRDVWENTPQNKLYDFFRYIHIKDKAMKELLVSKKDSSNILGVDIFRK